MTTHKASCQCGALVAEAVEAPDFVVACNCVACQKRTGSPFGAAAYFGKTVFNVTGEPKTWSRRAESGRKLENHFCETCGSTLYWTLEMRPDHVGVPIGNFDSDSPTPIRAIWMQEKHDWVSFPEDWPTYEKGSPS
ncbi:MAG: GFA family protein [Boseongicola sp.]|nr:GFA family protein [Boseongicola sp.]